jgi:flagellar biogenesis protein FliO
MKKLIFFLFSVYVFAANLINVDFFSHKNFIDILLSFDSKFEGKVIKITQNEYFLKGVKSNKKFLKIFDKDNFLRKVEVFPQNDGIKIILDTKKNTKISFALTPEGYGIRIRVEYTKPMSEEIQALKTQNPEVAIDYFTYFIMLAILIILAIILWIIRRKAPKLPIKKSDISMGVLIQKPIDSKNKVVLFEFNKRRYLMLVGNTNLLLDIFDEELQTINISTQKEFDDFLKLNNKMDEIKKYIQNAEKLKEFDETI